MASRGPFFIVGKESGPRRKTEPTSAHSYEMRSQKSTECNQSWVFFRFRDVQNPKTQKIQLFSVFYLYLRYIFSQFVLMVSASKYLKDTEVTSPCVSVSWIHFEPWSFTKQFILVLQTDGSRKCLSILKVHRDFCPQHVCLSAPNSRAQCRLTDAIKKDDPPSESALSLSLSLCNSIRAGGHFW